MAVVQARTASRRLPAKALLPIGGLPMVVLAAQRAANRGCEMLVATSSHKDDDLLADVVQRHGLRCYRGDLESPLRRIVTALESFDGETVVVRLTADNVFPDGQLIDEVSEEFNRLHLHYLCCNGAESGLPYGMSLEITRLGDLREALATTSARFDHEHVTPFIIRKFGARYFDKYCLNKSMLDRSTVDSLDDYLSVCRAFDGVPDPVAIPAMDLVRRLKALDDAPISLRPAADLVLGGAQFGQVYGIANTSGQPSPQVSEEILKRAIRNGVCYVDTGRAYGASEEVIGAVLSQGLDGRVKVITKLDPLESLHRGAGADLAASMAQNSVMRSCIALRTQALDVLLLHRASHLYFEGGAVWRELLRLQSMAKIADLGVSVQSPEELDRVIREPNVSFVQLPFNILDTRWNSVLPLLSEEKARRRLVVHVRSALLQGLLPSDDGDLWATANCMNHKDVTLWLRSTANRLGRANVTDLCLNFVRSQPWVDGVVVGNETDEQLQQNLMWFSAPKLSEVELVQARVGLPVLSEATLNPANWMPRKCA